MFTLDRIDTRACDHFGLTENWSAENLPKEKGSHKEPYERERAKVHRALRDVLPIRMDGQAVRLFASFSFK